MKKMTKEQQQVAALGFILAIIAGLLLYQYGSHFLPAPKGVLVVPETPSRLLIPAIPDRKAYERPEFGALMEVPEVPIKPMPQTVGRNPFKVDALPNTQP